MSCGPPSRRRRPHRVYPVLEFPLPVAIRVYEPHHRKGDGCDEGRSDGCAYEDECASALHGLHGPVVCCTWYVGDTSAGMAWVPGYSVPALLLSGAGLRLGVPTRYLRHGFMVPLRLVVPVRYLCHCIEPWYRTANIHRVSGHPQKLTFVNLLTFRRCAVFPHFRLTFRRCAEAERPREPAVTAFLPPPCPSHLPKVCSFAAFSSHLPKVCSFAAFSSHLPKVRRSGTPTRACCSCVSPSTMPVPPSEGVQFFRIFASPSEGA